jgi:hypothetical protein
MAKALLAPEAGTVDGVGVPAWAEVVPTDPPGAEVGTTDGAGVVALG